jgi:YbgC/YbaW family acyl-CoA thioester hydrolase
MQKTPFSFCRIRFSDCDLFGHLNNGRYLDYFLNAREDHLRDNHDFDLKSQYATGIGWVVGSHEIIYRKPAIYNEVVFISSTLLKAQPESLLVEMLMMDEQQQHVKSILWTTFIPVNLKTGKRENVSGEFMEFALGLQNNEINIEGGIRSRLNLKLNA